MSDIGARLAANIRELERKGYGYTVLPGNEPPYRYQEDEPNVGQFVTKSSGDREEFAGGGRRDTEAGKPRFDLLRPLTVPYEHQMLTRWAALMGRGAVNYGDRNWERMSDQAAHDRFRSSAARHFDQWLTGQRDEDHAAATFFNVGGAEYVRGVLSGLWLPLGGSDG